MNKRETALETIRTEFATHGKATEASTKAYVENVISYAAYTKAAWARMEAYFADAARVEQFDCVVKQALEAEL